MRYELVESTRYPGEWIVEAIDYDSEGEVYTAIFAKCKAKDRAEAYASLMNEPVAALASRLSD